jgi:hypothetical protein
VGEKMNREVLHVFPCITLVHYWGEPGEDLYLIDGFETTKRVWEHFKEAKK